MEENKPSRTALSIAASHIILAPHSPYSELIAPDQLEFSDALMKKFRNRGYEKMLRVRKRLWVVKLLGAVQGLLHVPGLATFHVCRKLAFQNSCEKIIKQKLEAGKKVQVVAFAAGFDTLMYRLARKYKDIQFFETDHPATQELKEDIYNELGFKEPNHTLISSDYTKQKLSDQLEATENFDQNIDTIFLAEGLMFYLPYDVFFDLLSYMKKYNDGESFMVFSFMQNRPGINKPGFNQQKWYVDYWLKKVSEPFLWGRTKDELEKDLGEQDYKMIEYYNGPKLRSEFMPSTDFAIANGEDVCTVRYRK